MSRKQKRKRTRAIRAEMAETGMTYTQAAANVGELPRFGRRTRALRTYVRWVFGGDTRDEPLCLARAEELERAGRRIVTDVETDDDGWEIRDWRTNAVLAEGNGELDGREAVRRLSPDGTWCHEDELWDVLEITRAQEGGRSQWSRRFAVGMIGIGKWSDEQVAVLVHWPVADVRELRRRLEEA